MTLLDRVIASIAPGWALERTKARIAMQAYEAAQSTRLRTGKRETRSSNEAIRASAKSIREQARWLDESYDLVAAMLDVFTNNVIGPHGIQIEPQPRTRDGDIHTDLAKQIQEVLREWSYRPEVTHQHSRAQMERLMALTWARDGEAFSQKITGNVPTLRHGSDIPFSLELIEPDLIPLDLNEAGKNLIQGIVVNAWGQPRAYHVYKQNPADSYSLKIDTKTIAAERMIHIKHVRRIGQVRGISRLATILTRIQDLKDYEDAERFAAKLASAMAVYVKKGTPDLYDSNTTDDEDPDRRLFQVAPGMMWVNLHTGEDVGTIDTSRPSNLLHPFRNSMLKAATAGVGVGYSSTSRDYSGTYAAQRQELVEQFVSYASSTGQFISQFEIPMYQSLIAAAIASRRLIIPRNVDPKTIDDAEYRGPVMPWIDPEKEANGNLIQVQAGFKSRAQVIRERGGNPQNVQNEIKRERQQDDADGLVFSSDVAAQVQTMTESPDE